MHLKFSKTTEWYLRAVLIVTLILLFVLGFSFIQQYVHLHRFKNTTFHIATLPTQSLAQSATIRDIAFVETWMTFDYIDHLFGLSPQSLKEKLGIFDKHYPHMTVGEYARIAHISDSFALANVQIALRASLAQNQ